MNSYTIFHIDENQNKKIIECHYIDILYYLNDFFLRMYKKNEINSLLKPTILKCLGAGIGYSYSVSLDKEKDILYFIDDYEFIEKEQSVPLAVQNIYNNDDSKIPLEIYMIEQGILSATAINFTNFCNLCEHWDFLSANAPIYLVLYQTSSDAEILLATFNTEQEALDFVTTK